MADFCKHLETISAIPARDGLAATAGYIPLPLPNSSLSEDLLPQPLHKHRNPSIKSI
jgi:hypothetical protein